MRVVSPERRWLPGPHEKTSCGCSHGAGVFSAGKHELKAPKALKLGTRAQRASTSLTGVGHSQSYSLWLIRLGATYVGHRALSLAISLVFYLLCKCTSLYICHIRVFKSP